MMEYSKSIREIFERKFVNGATWHDFEVDCLLREIDRLQSVEKAQEWIPVSDRLPEVNKRIMFFGGFEQTTHIGYYREPQWESENGGFWYGRNFGLITHWQPLPPPPTGETK